MKPIFGIPAEETYGSEMVEAARKTLTQGLNRGMERYTEVAEAIALEHFAEWEKESDIDLMARVSRLVAAINIRNFAGNECYAKYLDEFGTREREGERES